MGFTAAGMALKPGILHNLLKFFRMLLVKAFREEKTHVVYMLVAFTGFIMRRLFVHF